MATPLEISIALHYYCRADDYGKDNGDNNFNAPAVRDALTRFVRMGLLRQHPGESRDYSCTEGLTLFIKGLCSLPFPERQWVMPPINIHKREGA